MDDEKHPVQVSRSGLPRIYSPKRLKDGLSYVFCKYIYGEMTNTGRVKVEGNGVVGCIREALEGSITYDTGDGHWYRDDYLALRNKFAIYGPVQERGIASVLPVNLRRERAINLLKEVIHLLENDNDDSGTRLSVSLPPPNQTD